MTLIPFWFRLFGVNPLVFKLTTSGQNILTCFMFKLARFSISHLPYIILKKLDSH